MESASASPVRQAILGLPELLRAAYCEALEVAPEIVELDTPEHRFLAVEDGDVNRAAKRLASYWKARKELFRKRAFLPMVLCEGGALDERERTLFDSAYFVPAPDHTSGRPVAVADVLRLDSIYSYPSLMDLRLRCAFYTFSVMTENPVAQSEGVIVLFMLSKAPDDDSSRLFFRMLLDSFPIHSLESHLIVLPSVTDLGTFVRGAIDFVVSFVLRPFFQQIYVHQGQTDVEVLQKLVDHGFDLKGVPEWMGGAWPIQSFETWKRIRLESETQLYSFDRCSPDKKSKIIQEEVVLLQQKVDRMVSDNASVDASNLELEHLLSQAEALVFASSGGQEIPDEFFASFLGNVFDAT